MKALPAADERLFIKHGSVHLHQLLFLLVALTYFIHTFAHKLL
jgi:hypothetical protein